MNSDPLARRFDSLCRRLGGSADTATIAADLIARYAEPGRRYHGLDHLRDCLARLDGAPSEGADRDLVEAALWFHDAIYDPRAADNEERSAALARDRLTQAGVGAEAGVEVARLILLTRHREPPADPSGRLLCDVDLSILGRDTAEFERYEGAIRSEYAWVPEPVYRAERAAVLRRLLARNPLYTTEHFCRRYEEPARRNLTRSLAALTGG